MVAQDHSTQAYLSPSEAVEHYKGIGVDLGERTVYRAIQDGTLPAVRAGGRKLFIRVEDLDKLLTPVAGDAA